MATRKLSQKKLDQLRQRTYDALGPVLPATTNRVTQQPNPIPFEIANRIVENAKLVGLGTDLFKQTLIILADYRDHMWTGGALAGEGTRIQLADDIVRGRP